MQRRQFIRHLSAVPALFALRSCSKDSPSTQPPNPETDLQASTQRWFQDAKFGLFIHWGVYSVLGKGEWVMNNDQMSVEDYEKLPPQFNPTEFDPDIWVQLAKAAGMNYITITSKHHDGFAMWDSKISDYNIVKRTPYGNDVLKMLADACAREDMKLFFYHSHLDWHHPDYYPLGKTGHHTGRPDGGDFNRYLDYMDTQLSELAGGDYGKLAGFWFDGWWDQHIVEHDKTDTRTHVDWRLQKTYDLIHALQPHAIIGNNHHVLPFPGEGFQMFERDLPGQNTFGYNTTAIGTLPLETCDTMNGSWGYNGSDNNFKDARTLIHYLVRSAGANANLLLNVGPTPQGTFQPEVITLLQEIGEWTKGFGESIYGTRGGPMPPQAWGVSTRKEGKTYLHLLDLDAPETLALPGTSVLNITRATRLDTGETVPFSKADNLVLTLPQAGRHPIDTIIELG